jgi:hypothetical protein
MDLCEFHTMFLYFSPWLCLRCGIAKVGWSSDDIRPMLSQMGDIDDPE